MISREGINSSLYISEVLTEESRHILIQASALWDRSSGTWTRPLAFALFLLSALGKPVHGCVLSHIPGQSRELTCEIGRAHGKIRSCRTVYVPLAC